MTSLARELTPQEVNRLRELEQLIIKYMKVLNLDDENISMGVSNEDHALLQWDDDKDRWFIYLLPSDNDFTPVHELGHIYLARLTNNLYFAKSGMRIDLFDKILFRFLNTMVDCFVDCNLIKHTDLYELYIEDAHLWKHSKKKGKIEGELIDLSYGFDTLIACYLSLKLIDKEKNRREFIDLKNYLRKVKELIRKTVPNRKINFESLESKLDRFDDIKDKNDSKMIIDFFYSILCETSLWNDKVIKRHLRILFPKE